ncbi:MAG: hypothetical protein NC093_00785 [Alistipes sp.]|nr:hypothetical protein [Alistipes sp.]
MNDENSASTDIINVIDQFDYSTQDEQYNEKYRSWRMRKDNRYAFTFKGNRKESVYVDSRGFVKKTAKETENDVLSKIFYTIGIGLLMFVVFDDLLSKLIIILLGRIGVNINTSFSTGSIYGGSWEIAAALMIVGFLRAAIPLVYFHFKFRLPMHNEIMWKLRSPKALFGAVAMAFIVFAAANLPNAYSTETKEVFSFFAAGRADISVLDQTEFLVYLIFDVLIIPIITQLLFCGAMFAVLRQFGDTFAIMMTSLSAALMTQDIHSMPAVFLVTAVCGYGMLASGTIFTAFSINILYKMFLTAIATIESIDSPSMPIYRNLFMSAVLVVGGIGFFLYMRSSAKEGKPHLAVYTSEISFNRRVLGSAKTFPYSAVAIICLVYAIMKAVL